MTLKAFQIIILQLYLNKFVHNKYPLDPLKYLVVYYTHSFKEQNYCAIPKL